MPKRYSLGSLLASAILLVGCGAPVVPTPLTGSHLMAASGVQFGMVPVGGTRSSSFAVSNAATDGTNIIVSRINVAGPGFRLGNVPAFPMTIAPGESVTLGIEFSPKVNGAVKGNVSIMSDATDPVLPISLTGNGNSGTTTPVTVSPAALNFGNVGVGTTAVLNGTLIAGSSDVTISTVDETGSGYSLGGINFPVALAAGQQLPFSVTFAPQAAGAATGTLSFVTNASSSPTATLTGSGSSQATSHSVSLSWSASTSPVAGYNIYRSAQSGGPYAKLTGSPTPSTVYADTAVQSGSTYYYVATSVNNSSEESGYSNQTIATIP